MHATVGLAVISLLAAGDATRQGRVAVVCSAVWLELRCGVWMSILLIAMPRVVCVSLVVCRVCSSSFR